jgi:nitroreductase
MLGTAPVMPDALELLKGRRSTRVLDLAEPGPSDAQIDQILTIAARVPDHGKLVPWRFVVLVGEGRKRMADTLALRLRAAVPPVAEDQIEKERSRFANSPVIVALVSRAGPHPKIPEWEQVLSAGNAAFALVMAAHALGFAANWKTGFIAYDADARRVLGLTDAERVVALVHVGTPTVPPTERPRPDLAAIVTRWTPPSPG